MRGLPWILGALTLVGAAASAGTLDAGWRIVVPVKTADSSVWSALRQSADELQHALRDETGHALDIVESSDPVMGKAVYIGSSFARRAGLETASLRGWDNVYAERNGSLYLYGNEDRCGQRDRRSVGWAHCVLPSIRALTRFMEDRMGVRFVMPGVTGMEVPAGRAVEVPVGLASVERPAISFGAGGNQGMLSSIANQCLGAGAYKTFGGHLYPVACPMERYAKSHPEYFGLIKGKRYCEWPWAKNNFAPLCFTNPEVEDLIVSEMLRHYDAGADSCQLAPSDSALYCECEKCQDYGGLRGNAGVHHSEQLWLFHRHVAERVEKLRPGKIVHILSYGPTRHPPRDFKTFPPNVMIEVCETTAETLGRWRDFRVPHGLTAYIYLWGNYKLVGYTPRHSFRELAETARMYMSHGVHGIYRCGYGELWGLEGPGYYVFNRMLRNPGADVAATVREFCTAAFGTAAETMLRFYSAYDIRLDRIRPVAEASIDLSGGDGFMATFAKEANLAMLSRMWTDDVLREMGMLLATAETTAGLGERHRRRLKLVRLEYDYLVRLMEVIRRYGTFRGNPCRDTVRPLLDAIDGRNAFLDRLCDPKTGHVRIFDTWPELRLFGYASRDLLRHNGRSAGKIEEPLAWNTADVRAAYDVDAWRKGLEARTGIVRLTAWRLSEGQENATLETLDGGRRIRLVPAKGTDDVRVQCGLALRPRTRYRLSWLVRLKGVLPTQKSHEAYALVKFGPDAASRKTFPVSGLKLDTTDWLKRSVQFETGDVLTDPTLAFRLWHCRGEAWFCDVVLEEVSNITSSLTLGNDRTQ